MEDSLKSDKGNDEKDLDSKNDENLLSNLSKTESINLKKIPSDINQTNLSNNLNTNKNSENSNPDLPKDTKVKPKKEIPIEKKPFKEFINDNLTPSLISEFKQRGLEVVEINLQNTTRPIAGDKCWVIYCEIKNTCNFWLSFEKEDITSPKSISLCKKGQNPSVIESFLIDEKRITLKLIISRLFQRLNGQKLIGVN